MPEQIIERLIEVSEKQQFIPELVKDKSNVFIYHITSKVLGVFFGTSASENVARINAFKQMFELLHKLSYLISTFKLCMYLPYFGCFDLVFFNCLFLSSAPSFFGPN